MVTEIKRHHPSETVPQGMGELGEISRPCQGGMGFWAHQFPVIGLKRVTRAQKAEFQVWERA